MSQETLDARYTDGIWYDGRETIFCEIQEAAGSNEVELIKASNGGVYETVPIEKWCDVYEADFHKVSDKAVNNPSEVVESAVRMMKRNATSSFNKSDEIDLKWASKQVKIVER